MVLQVDKGQHHRTDREKVSHVDVLDVRCSVLFYVVLQIFHSPPPNVVSDLVIFPG